MGRAACQGRRHRPVGAKRTGARAPLAVALALVLAWMAAATAGGAGTPAIEPVPAARIAALDGPVVQARIEKFEYAPMELKVAPGTTVVWTNYDLYKHDVMVLAKNSPAAEDLRMDLVGRGGRIAVTFHEPGTYTYICSVHPFMQATVVVEGRKTAAASARRGTSPARAPAQRKL